MFRIYKRLMDVFTEGDLIRIKKTGEIYRYHSSTGGANFSSYLVIVVLETLVDYKRSLHVDDVEKVDKTGKVIDDFKQYRR